MMKPFTLILFLLPFYLIVSSFDGSYQQSYQKMIVGKWQPVLSTSEGVEADGKLMKQSKSNFSSKDIMQFNADGSINDSGQLYFSYALDPEDHKTLSLFEGGNYERKFEIAQLDKTTMKIVMRDIGDKADPIQITWTLVFKRK